MRTTEFNDGNNNKNNNYYNNLFHFSTILIFTSTDVIGTEHMQHGYNGAVFGVCSLRV